MPKITAKGDVPMKEKKKTKKIRAEKDPSDKSKRNNKYNIEGTATPPIGETPEFLPPS